MPDILSISLCCLITNIKRKPEKTRNQRSGPGAIANRREYIRHIEAQYGIHFLPAFVRSKGRFGVVTSSKKMGLRQGVL